MADSIREALTAAYAEAEKEPEPVADPAPVQDSATFTESEQPEKVNEAPSTKSTETVDNPNAGADSASVAGKQTAPATAAAPAPSEPVEKVPSSWTSAERGLWAGLPAEARKAVLRREEEIQRVLENSSGARRSVEQYEKVVSPYKPLFDKYGLTPHQAIGPLLATRAALELGTPAQKAELVANIIADFGVDIEQLDAAIVQGRQGGPRRPQTPPPQVDYRAVPELAPLFELAEMAKQRQASAAAEAVATVSSLPHFEEVRNTMADVIDQAKARGKQLAIDAAYRVACQIHGLEVPAPAAPAVTPSQAASILAKARNAASSVSGAPVPTSPKQPESIREHLEAQFAARRM